MRNAFTLVVLFATLCLQSGCSTVPEPGVPALRTSGTAASLEELTGVVRSALNGVPVTLADDVLMTESRLTIERSATQRIGQPQMPGRSYERPEHFDLVLDGRQCFLVHADTELRWMLVETTCEPG